MVKIEYAYHLVKLSSRLRGERQLELLNQLNTLGSQGWLLHSSNPSTESLLNSMMGEVSAEMLFTRES